MTSKAGEELWRGPRVRMSIYSGYPDSLETSSGELVFVCQHTFAITILILTLRKQSGPVVERAKSMLRLQSHGSIIASVPVVNQLERGAGFVDHIVMEQYDLMNPNEILQVFLLPQFLFARPFSLPSLVGRSTSFTRKTEHHCSKR